ALGQFAVRERVAGAAALEVDVGRQDARERLLPTGPDLSRARVAGEVAVQLLCNFLRASLDELRGTRGKEAEFLRHLLPPLARARGLQQQVMLEVPDDALDLLGLHLGLEMLQDLRLDVGDFAAAVQERRDDKRQGRQDNLVLEQLLL